MPNPDMYIYLDEFERGDVHVISAMLVPSDVAAQFLADWDSLRKEIKEVLIVEYPGARENRHLQGHLLPEIHAVELFQSGGYYRKYKHGEKTSDRYWLQHYAWLEKALVIIKKHDIQFLVTSVNPRKLESPVRGLQNLFSGIFFDVSVKMHPLVGKYSRAKLIGLSKNKYFFCLIDTLLTVEHHLRTHNLYGEVICDDHEMSKGFSIIESFDWLKQRGHYQHLSKPRFASGLDESLLQACDVFCYVAGQYVYAEYYQIPLKEPLKLWAHTIVSHAWTGNEQDYYRVNRHPAPLIALELSIEMCVEDGLYKAQMKKRIREFYQEMRGTS